MVEGTRRGNSSLSLSLKFKCGWDSDETEPPTPRAAPGTTAMSNMGGEVLSTTTVSSSHEYERDCIRIQDQLKTKLVVGDDFAWILPSGFSSSPAAAEGEAEEDKSLLRYIGGVDVSFSKADRNSSSSLACAALVVLDARSLKLIYEDYTLVRIHTPYVPGFLAFREAPVLLQLLDKMKRDDHPHYPQVLMVDGNGLLHPRGGFREN
ncbi:endonuclease V-like isoform X3 [Asparagus officinalis]|uniref:endonuclease V-like isoform X2 n=1 Tax=Asparagus officinalis TaxID=4686 RepID=UPI00098E2442|nr:endonuclease V-like isoform X2 [Asparagus officinalis]XP_020265984.1 endonuclease V-like isoform X3 [Asparagus officinalis]